MRGILTTCCLSVSSQFNFSRDLPCFDCVPGSALEAEDAEVRLLSSTSATTCTHCDTMKAPKQRSEQRAGELCQLGVSFGERMAFQANVERRGAVGLQKKAKSSMCWVWGGVTVSVWGGKFELAKISTWGRWRHLELRTGRNQGKGTRVEF